MGVKLPVLVIIFLLLRFLSINRNEGSPMPTHRVREGALEEIVVAHEESAQRLGQIKLVTLRQRGQSGHMLMFRQEQRLVRPERPVGNHSEPVLTLDHSARAVTELLRSVV